MAKFNDTLLCRDARKAIRVIYMSLEWSDELHAYVLSRSTGILGKKITQQPIIEIKRGKAQRTVTEQATLQYNSELKKYLDKGYKKVQELGIQELTIENAENALPNENTDQNGVLKPMLCKVMDRDKTSQTDKQWLASYKHDGVRCLLFLRDGEVHTASRGGQDYDIPATYIREDPYVKQIFKENPDIILDGEIYRHLWNLQHISGLCRREELVDEHKELVFHCYDIVDTTSPFKLRARKLGQLNDARPDNSRIIFVEHRPVKGLDQIMQMHDEAIAAGYEGLVVRDPEKEYKPGARDNRMMKIKLMSDDEFVITGLSEGLRDEDMCFTLETQDGTEFKAKPLGDRLQKQWYREHLDEIIGQMGTVKHFGWTTGEYPVPNLPVFKSIRWDSDLD